MFSKGDMAKLESILKYIGDIQSIIKRHGSIESSLVDLEGQYSIMMCFMQIGELLNKIESDSLKNTLPIKYAVAFRNIIVHNYDGVDFTLAENTIKNSLPKLANTVKTVFGSGKCLVLKKQLQF